MYVSDKIISNLFVYVVEILYRLSKVIKIINENNNHNYPVNGNVTERHKKCITITFHEIFTFNKLSDQRSKLFVNRGCFLAKVIQKRIT